MRQALFVSTYLDNKILFLIFVNILLLFMGMFMEGSATIILLAPVGVCLFIGCGIGRIKLWEGAKKIAPFILAEILVLLMVSYIPALTISLPRAADLIK